MSTIKDSVADAEKFLLELGRGIPDTERVMVGYASEATRQTDKNGKTINGGWWPTPYKPDAYIDHNNNCYVCISSSIKTLNEKTGRMRYWRGESSFGHGLALMVDDIGDGTGSKGGLDLAHFERILPPTAIVETSPGNHQLFYFLIEPEPNRLLFKGLLVSFVEAVLRKGGDNTIKDVSRYGRMPCGYNNKRHEDQSLKYPSGTVRNGSAAPWKVRLGAADYSRRYTPYEIAQAFGFVINVQMPSVPTDEERAERRTDEPLNSALLRAAIEALKGQGEGTGGEVRKNASGKYRITCPWGDEHSNGDPSGAYFRGPISGGEHDYVFGCAHDGCRKARRTWTPFIDYVVMPYIVNELERANRSFA